MAEHKRRRRKGTVEGPGLAYGETAEAVIEANGERGRGSEEGRKG